MKNRLAFLAFAILAAVISEAQTADRFDYSSLRDTNEARARYLTSVVTANWNSASRFPDTIMSSSNGRIQISVEREEDFFYIRFLRERDGAFPLPGTGNVVVQRNYQRNGDLIQAKLFLNDDPSCYIRLYPQNERTKADIVLYGTVAKQGIILPQIFYYQLRDHLSRLITNTAGAFDWGVFFRAPAPVSETVRFRDALASVSVNGGSAGARLIHILAAEDDVALFLESQAKAQEAEEIVRGPTGPFVQDKDARRTATYKPFPPYDTERGFPLSAAAALVHCAALEHPDDVAALFVRDEGYLGRILLLGGFDERGVFGIRAYDTAARAFLDWPAFLDAHRQGYARVVRVPAPGV